MNDKPRIRLMYSDLLRRNRWNYEPRCARENLCTWAQWWCAERNSKEGR